MSAYLARNIPPPPSPTKYIPFEPHKSRVSEPQLYYSSNRKKPKKIAFLKHSSGILKTPSLLENRTLPIFSLALAGPDK